MLLLSLNLRGIRITLKATSVQRLLDQTRPDIVFLQETLVHEKKPEISCIISDLPGYLVL
jgi:exonuclease III